MCAHVCMHARAQNLLDLSVCADYLINGINKSKPSAKVRNALCNARNPCTVAGEHPADFHIVNAHQSLLCYC